MNGSNESTVAPESNTEKLAILIPLRFFPRRPARPCSVWLATVLTMMVLVYGVVVPSTAGWPLMQAFADSMSRIIPQLEEAAAVTDFEQEARLMLALDRALVPVWILLGLAFNTQIRINRNNHPIVKIAIFICTFLPLTLYFYLYPYVPEPCYPDEYCRRNVYPLMTHGLLGFSLPHAVFSVAMVLLWSIFVLVILRFRVLQRAYDEWNGRS